MSTHRRAPEGSAAEISVICPVTRYAGDLAEVHEEFRDVLARTGRSLEFIYVIDGIWTGAEGSLARIREERYPVRILRMARGFGEATALQVGIEEATGRHVLTIPDRPQIDPRVVDGVLARLDAGEPVVVTRREPRSDALLNRLQTRAFHGLVRRLVGHDFKDMACGVRGFSAEAARALELYGDQHRFIPVIAARLGYRVTEIPGAQHPENRGLRLYGPGIYIRRLLDILTIFFLTRFTRKPLRFFGLIGVAVGAVGLAICLLLAAQRLLGNTALADRPLLLLGVLLVVIGVQITSIGLLGEIIMFLSARRETPAFSELPAADAGVRQDPVRTAAGTDLG
jgi:hypothetical protein